MAARQPDIGLACRTHIADTHMIGLKRDTVRLVAYDPEWARLFDSEASALHERIGELVVDVQHVGSTAVPGLIAKPILDVAAAVKSSEVIPAVARRLASAGFVDRGDAGSAGGYLLVKDLEPDIRLVHVHIVELEDPQWQEYLIFRDALRTNQGLRGDYADLKRRLAEQYPDDRTAYTAGKQRFVRQALARLRDVRDLGHRSGA